MTPIFLLIVVNLSVIRISNAQFDCSNESHLDERGKIFCVFDVPTAIVEHPNQTSGNSPNRAQTYCGLRNVGGLGIGSSTISTSANEYDAEFAEFPWTVAVMDYVTFRSICGGSLIHPKVVLTTFHNVAIYGLKPVDLKVRAGEWDMQSTAERLPYQERNVSRIIGHPDYSANLGHIYDIALIELTDAFVLDVHIGTVCLPAADFVPYQQDCFANGWGKDTVNNLERKRNILKKVPLGIVESSKCERALQSTRLGRRFHLDSTFICAGGVDGIDTCQGDGGAPLVCPDPNRKTGEKRYIQNGIVSWGIGCNEAIPAVYVNVAIFRQWIDETIQFIGLDTSTYTTANNNND